MFSPRRPLSLRRSSYYTGVSNIFRYELATQKVEAVSNASTGFFRPIPRADGKLMVYEYAGRGFTPVVIDPVPLQDLGAIKFLGAEIAAKHPIVKQWAVGSPASVAARQPDHRARQVRARQRTEARRPSTRWSRATAATSPSACTSIFEDPLQFHQATATVAYSPGPDVADDERLHVNLEYRTLKWRVRYWHNGADFYDLFGPTYRSRKGDAVLVGYKKL